MSIRTVKGSDLTLAPEGGWGYLVVISISFVLLVTFGNMPCLGILYADFLEGLGHHTRALTMLPSCFFIFISTTGLFAKYLFDRFSVRSVAIVGGILFCSGSVMMVFVSSLSGLLLVYGVLQGIGFGLATPAMYTTFIQYFVKRRVMMMAFAGVLQGIGSVGMPLCIDALMKEFGFRGCLAIIAAFNLHFLLAMIVLHPVEWHQKTVVRRPRNMPTVNDSQELPEVPSRTLKSKRNVWGKMVDFLDLTLFFNPVYTNICIGMSMALSADTAFITIRSTYLRQTFTKEETAEIISIGSAADIISRVILTLVSTPLQIRARPLYLAGAILTIASLVALPYVTSYAAVSVINSMFGYFRAWTHVPISLIFAELLPAERFASGHGLYVFIQGLSMFALGPFIGWVRDYTQSFEKTFYVIILAMVACVVLWSIEMLVTHFRKAKQPTKDIEISD